MLLASPCLIKVFQKTYEIKTNFKKMKQIHNVIKVINKIMEAELFSVPTLRIKI